MDTLISIPELDRRIIVANPANTAMEGSDTLTSEQKKEVELIRMFQKIRPGGQRVIMSRPSTQRRADRHQWREIDHVPFTAGRYAPDLDRVDFFDRSSEFIFMVDEAFQTIHLGCRVVFDMFGLPAEYVSNKVAPEDSIELTQFFIGQDCCDEEYPAVCFRQFGHAVQSYLDGLQERSVYLTNGRRYQPYIGELVRKHVTSLHAATVIGVHVPAQSVLCIPLEEQVQMEHEVPTYAEK